MDGRRHDVTGGRGDGVRRKSVAAVRVNQIHRGLAHLLVTGAIRRSHETLQAWAEREKIAASKRFRERRGSLPPDVVRLPDRLGDLLSDLEGFLADKYGIVA